MKKHLIEVFVEENCRACEEVLSVLRTTGGQGNIDIHVFSRTDDVDIFRQRAVLICHATFVNKKLVFYGSFSGSALRRYLHSTTM